MSPPLRVSSAGRCAAAGGSSVPTPRARYGALFAAVLTLHFVGLAQEVDPVPEPLETPGERPYEMVWAGRTEPAPPTVRFDELTGWRIEVAGNAGADLRVTRAQDLWNRPVARLRYHGNGQADSTPRIHLVPPAPIPVPGDADAVVVWVYGNRWEWENPPDTPAVRIQLQIRDADGAVRQIALGPVRWKEWWLIHRRLPPGKAPWRLERVTIEGGHQTEPRELFFDSIRFHRENLPPLKFAPRPERNLRLFTGQSPGANTGPGRLPFPTREETILPLQLAGVYSNHVQLLDAGGYRFTYHGADGTVSYDFQPAAGLGSLRATFNGELVGDLMRGAVVRSSQPTATTNLSSVTVTNGVVAARYDDGTLLRLRLWQKSLVLDVINQTGQATEFGCGELTSLVSPRTISIPFLNYGSRPHPCVLLSRAGTNAVFTSIWLDWYRSNGSEPFAAETNTATSARINGGVRYQPHTAGQRNPMFERFFLTVSPMFEEVLPVIPTPTGLHAAQAGDRLWQESWGPADYEREMARSRRLRAYGIEKLIQCNHEITWRDGGESFTLRTRAAPKRGGDDALRRYVAHQRSLGWLSGLYSNYTDFAPVNEHWSPDWVQRAPDANWRTAWPRNYALKPLKAVEFDALLAPQIKARYEPNSAYTDVHTAVAPWAYTDYDARVPGAGTFAQTLYAYGELLRNDSQVYGGPVFSEGTYHWLYAGLADGNYALAYDGRPLAREPLLPVFDLLQIHPKECDIGMGWTAHFCDPMGDWKAPENLDRAIDRFLLHTLAYGHIGWLVEEAHGIERMCRSYYMLQQVQARYALQAPERIAYWDGAKLVSVSEALVRDLPATRRQLHVRYPGGLGLWLNDHTNDFWRVSVGGRTLDLPPAGWAAVEEGGDLLSYSALGGTNKVDYLRSRAYVYLDGRGSSLETPEAATSGALALSPTSDGQLEVVHISGTNAFTVRRPFQYRGGLETITAFDLEGKPLRAPDHRDAQEETCIQPTPGAVRYLLRFRGGASGTARAVNSAH